MCVRQIEARVMVKDDEFREDQNNEHRSALTLDYGDANDRERGHDVGTKRRAAVRYVFGAGT